MPLKHEGHERNTNDAKGDERHEKGVSRFSRPFVNFVFHRSQLIQPVQRFEGLTEEEIVMVEGQNDARAG